MGLAEEFRAKVEGRSSKNFYGALPPDPLSHCPPFICHIFVLISKISGVAWGLVYLEFIIGNGDSIRPNPNHSHLHCDTKIYLVCKSFGGKYSVHKPYSADWLLHLSFSIEDVFRSDVPY